MLHRIALCALSLTAAVAAQFTCSASTFATGCGPVMSMSFSPQGNGGSQSFDITCVGLQPNVIGVMAWGVQPLGIDLGGGCQLHVDYLWGHTFQTGPTGDFAWSRSWPTGAMPNTYLIQFGSVEFRPDGSLGLRASNAVRAQCL
jgi:hypothetical protein